MKPLLIALLGVAVIGGGGWWYVHHSKAPEVNYRTAEVKQGDMLASIGATGTLEPEEVVDVGAQVAGQIIAFGQDPHDPKKLIDYNTKVEEGTVLARIDPFLPQSDVDQAQASYNSAVASVDKAKADLEQATAKMNQATHDWERAQKVGPNSDALSQSDYDMYHANYEIAKANVSVATAAVAQAKTSVALADAQLKKAQRNLGYCTITSPVKGVIIDRRVNIGQTVVSSLNAPSLFLIAKDLSKMQVWVAVNEADVGNIHPGQNVTFTVDGLPHETFHGKVDKVRLNATMTQNVVTYTVEVLADNPDEKLLPYQTANVQFETARRNNVLMVPNAALRWFPQPEEIAPEVRAEADALAAAAASGEAGPAPSPAAPPVSRRMAHPSSQPVEPVLESRDRVLWIKDGAYVRPLKIKSGLTDGTNTEVQGEGLKPGLQVVTGEVQQDQTDTTTKNPFTPQMGRRGPRR